MLQYNNNLMLGNATTAVDVTVDADPVGVLSVPKDCIMMEVVCNLFVAVAIVRCPKPGDYRNCGGAQCLAQPDVSPLVCGVCGKALCAR